MSLFSSQGISELSCDPSVWSSGISSAFASKYKGYQDYPRKKCKDSQRY